MPKCLTCHKNKPDSEIGIAANSKETTLEQDIAGLTDVHICNECCLYAVRYQFQNQFPNSKIVVNINITEGAE